jgi:hypothetical protein
MLTSTTIVIRTTREIIITLGAHMAYPLPDQTRFSTSPAEESNTQGAAGDTVTVIALLRTSPVTGALQREPVMVDSSRRARRTAAALAVARVVTARTVTCFPSSTRAILGMINGGASALQSVG